MKKRDVAWGFFYASTVAGRRVLNIEESRASAISWHTDFTKRGKDPTAVFRIVPPKPKPRKKVKHGR